VEQFTPQARDDALARRLGVGDGPVIGYISTLAVFEGIETLLEATAELRRRGRRVRCLIVGDGLHGPALKELSHSLGLDDGTAVFTGRVAYADINAYYSIIDAFVVPRHDVGVSRLVTPLKPYEAMAMERVVVMSRLDALMGMIIEGDTGVSFTPGDARDLADVLEPLLVDPERRDAIGRAAGAWVREHRSWRGNAQRYLELYQRLGAA
jgi:glycosyltransferase involved in cell wall biosynthesis